MSYLHLPSLPHHLFIPLLWWYVAATSLLQWSYSWWDHQWSVVNKSTCIFHFFFYLTFKQHLTLSCILCPAHPRSLALWQHSLGFLPPSLAALSPQAVYSPKILTSLCLVRHLCWSSLQLLQPTATSMLRIPRCLSPAGILSWSLSFYSTVHQTNALAGKARTCIEF